MKKTIVAGLVLVTSVVATAVVACSSGGSGSGSGGAGAVSSVDSSKSMSSLTDSEAKQYCEDAQNYQKTQLSDADRKKFTCVLTARIFASFGGAKDDTEAKAECQTQFDKCMAGPDPSADAGAQAAACDNFKARLTDCTATVAEANQCVADTATEERTVANEEPCANVHADAGASTASFFSQPASCDALAQKCPGLTKSTSTSGSSGG